MAEYIDRKEALDALLDGMVMTGYQSRAMDCVRFIPAADVAEVKHGRWEQHYDDPWDVHCSICDFAVPNTVVRPNYCENCGARMDERSEDNV